MTTHGLTAGWAREANTITVALAAPCGLTCAGSVIPGLDQAVTAALLTLGGLALTLLALRWVAGRVRELVEDGADARTAAAWRAQHAPHLLTATDRAAARVPVVARRGWT